MQELIFEANLETISNQQMKNRSDYRTENFERGKPGLAKISRVESRERRQFLSLILFKTAKIYFLNIQLTAYTSNKLKSQYIIYRVLNFSIRKVSKYAKS